jgi:hypothetical protein
MSRTEFARVWLAVLLLLDRRIVLFAIADLLFLFFAVMSALGGSGYAADFWYWLFLAPSLVLGVPMLAEAVAVERRAGTLDLALSSPSATWYFERRIGGASALLVLQGWLAVLGTRLVVNENFPLTDPLLRVPVVTLFLAAAALNWAVRFKAPGAVVFATYATAIAFAPWFFANPIQAGGGGTASAAALWIASLKANVALAGAATVFYLYALQRLRNPELLIS